MGARREGVGAAALGDEVGEEEGAGAVAQLAGEAGEQAEDDLPLEGADQREAGALAAGGHREGEVDVRALADDVPVPGDRSAGGADDDGDDAEEDQEGAEAEAGAAAGGGGGGELGDLAGDGRGRGGGQAGEREAEAEDDRAGADGGPRGGRDGGLGLAGEVTDVEGAIAVGGDDLGDDGGGRASGAHDAGRLGGRRGLAGGRGLVHHGRSHATARRKFPHVARIIAVVGRVRVGAWARGRGCAGAVLHAGRCSARVACRVPCCSPPALRTRAVKPRRGRRGRRGRAGRRAGRRLSPGTARAGRRRRASRRRRAGVRGRVER